GAAAPAERVRVLGEGFGGSIAADVWAGTRALPVLASAPGDLTVQLPADIAESSVRLEVRVAGQAIGGADLGIAPAAPGVLPFVLNQDGWPNQAGRPAPAGGVIVLFATGLGALSGTQPALPLTAAIADLPADVLAAEASASAPGVVYVAVRVPGGFLPPGGNPLVLSVNGVAAPAVNVWTR
ncbi:MAG: hypothetical protein KGN36_10710, partial [Acidobacteriota bacterium]|nr:hypothetical protein [Acidobacteriota bacterium]